MEDMAAGRHSENSNMESRPSPPEQVHRLQRGIELFTKLVDERTAELQSIVCELNKILADFESVHHSNTVGSLSGNIVVLVAGIISILAGIVLFLNWRYAPAQIGLYAAVGIATCGGVALFFIKIKRVRDHFCVKKDISKHVTEFQSLIGPIEQSLTEIYDGAEQLRHESESGTRVSEALKCSARLPRDVPGISNVAHLAKGISDVAQLASLPEMGLVERAGVDRQPPDICMVCRDANELYEMSSDRRGQSQSDALKLIEALRVTARGFQRAVDELRECRDVLSVCRYERAGFTGEVLEDQGRKPLIV